MCPLLIRSHQPGVTSYIGSENCGQSTESAEFGRVARR
jgi:hypothetical protein